MQSSIQRIGVIGLGQMGSDFASNLIADGFQVKSMIVTKNMPLHSLPEEQTP